MKKTNNLRVLLIEDNLINSRIVEAMLSRVEDQTFLIQCAESLVAALDLLARDIFDVALVDLSLPDSNGLETFLSVQRNAPLLPIIVLTGLADESVALNAVQHGAQDFLAKGTLNKETLLRALNYAIARSRNPSEMANQHVGKGKIIGVVGSSGGVGTTTLACHFALELGKSEAKALLIDLDVCSAASSFLMKATSQHTLMDAAHNLHRLDSSFWKGIVCSPTEGVDLLQAPGAVGLSDPLDVDRIRHVLRSVRSIYEWTVVDLGRLTASRLTLLGEIQDLFIITTPHVPALYETVRLLQRLVDSGISRDKLRLLLNRKSKEMVISEKDVEKALGYPLYGWFGDYSSEINGAQAEGRFIDEKLRLHSQVARVMRKLRGIEEISPSRFGFNLLRLARTTV
jgi:Flp pilus assembly CpaE family ATPase